MTKLRLGHGNLYQITYNLLYKIIRNIQFLNLNILNVALTWKERQSQKYSELSLFSLLSKWRKHDKFFNSFRCEQSQSVHEAA